MNKFDWDKFRNERVAVNCRTEEAAKEFIKECYKKDIKWYEESMNTTYYNIHKEETVYVFDKDFKTLGYADTLWCKKTGYEVVEYISEKNDEQTEFSFQEVIARNVPGTYVNCNINYARIKAITILKNGNIQIKAEFEGLDTAGSTLGISDNVRFKLQKTKKQYTLVEVIHAVNGKHYTFRDRYELNPDTSYLQPHEFVICDTSMGKTFGRVAGTFTKELTEKEYMEYKECWRAM